MANCSITPTSLAIAAMGVDAQEPTSKPTAPPSLIAVAQQLALELAGLSPGLIDGKIGPKTRVATREFQIARKLGPSGELDPATLIALGASSIEPTRNYAITPDDAKDVGGPLPTDWNEKARLDRLRYESFAQLVAERGMTSIATVEWLNPGVKLDKLKAGDVVKIPNSSAVEAVRLETLASLEIDLTNKLVRGRNAAGVTVALFPCSVAKDKSNLPKGDARTYQPILDPTYSFKPASWPEVHNVTRELLINPGPRNPVGLCWIGLSLPGYGIHGTPVPEMIGKTGSHGCIRLTNWHAVRLGKSVVAETPVKFIR